MDNKEKRLRKDSSTIGFGLFLIVVLEIILYVFLEKFLRRSVFLNNQLDLIRKVTDIFVYLLVPAIIFSLMLKLKGKKIKKIVNLNFKREKLWVYIAISFFVIEFANFATIIFVKILKLIHIKSAMPNFNCGDTALSIFLSIIGLAVVPAIAEEFVFRGAILNLLKPYGEKFAILASSLLFGLLHGNVEQFVFAFLTGLYFAYVAYKTESIIPGVIMHFLNNFSSLVCTLFKSNEKISSVLSIFFIVLGIIGFIVLLSLNFKKIFNFNFQIFKVFKRSRKNIDIKFNDKINALVFNPGMSLFLIESLILFYFSLESVY